MSVCFWGVTYGSEALIKHVYSLAEEIANSISHGIGLVFGIVGWSTPGPGGRYQRQCYGDNQLQPLRRQYDPAVLASTLYHAIPHQRAKMWLKKFDHRAIYLLIAGPTRDSCWWGWIALACGMMIVIWSRASMGILFKLTIAHRFKILSLVTYLTTVGIAEW
ncbi:hemolysin III family protein [Shigella flexneri]